MGEQNGTKERVAVRVARQLVAEIRQRRLGPGTQLDPEHRMVEDFGVARGTLRESLRFLELQGALRIKAGPGGGPIVSVPGAEHLASVLSLHLQFAEATFRSVIDARRSIYPVLAAQAAERSEKSDLMDMREGIARLYDAIGDSERHPMEARRLLTMIASASRNRVLAVLVEALHRMSEGVGPGTEKQHRISSQAYDEVVQAIEAGDADAARTLMDRFLATSFRYWERTAPEQLDEPVSWIDVDR